MDKNKKQAHHKTMRVPVQKKSKTKLDEREPIEKKRYEFLSGWRLAESDKSHERLSDLSSKTKSFQKGYKSYKKSLILQNDLDEKNKILNDRKQAVEHAFRKFVPAEIEKDFIDLLFYFAGKGIKIDENLVKEFKDFMEKKSPDNDIDGLKRLAERESMV